jgi:hypothetical protein
MIKPGQIWENGRAIVKVQKADECNLLAITFNIGHKGTLTFSHSNTFAPEVALEYVLSLSCQLTDKKLALSAN